MEAVYEVSRLLTQNFREVQFKRLRAPCILLIYDARKIYAHAHT